jgi:uncharacterized protein (DUF2345 family)
VAPILSTLLFVAAIGFAAVAAWFYFDERRDQPEENIPPTAQPGQHNLASVVTALQDAGVDAKVGRGTTALTEQLPDQRGQLVDIGDGAQELYVFIYTDPTTGVEDRQAASDALDPATLTLSTRAGQDLAEGEELHVSAGSNVIAVLAGGDDELVAQVQEAIESLP